MIEIRLLGKMPIREIARGLGRDHSVISREVRRNTVAGKRYRAEHADRLAEARAKKTNIRKLEKDDFLRRYVIEQLRDRRSPEQIAGKLRKHSPPELKGKIVSHETVYQYIYEGEGRWEHLYPCLRRARKKRRHHYARRPRKTPVPERISIHLRPREVQEKMRVGDWESDTMVFRKQKTALSVQYERKLMLTRIHRVLDRSAEETENALVKSVESLPQDLWQTITFDNGGEGARHTRFRNDYGIGTYFCDAYASWQKGGVENANGLIRQYFPRGTDLSKVSDTEIHAVQEALNNRPRKTLNYLSPNEALALYYQTSGALNP